MVTRQPLQILEWKHASGTQSKNKQDFHPKLKKVVLSTPSNIKKKMYIYKGGQEMKGTSDISARNVPDVVWCLDREVVSTTSPCSCEISVLTILEVGVDSLQHDAMTDLRLGPTTPHPLRT